MSYKYYYVYQDDGPKGCSPQCMSITIPWERLWISDKELSIIEIQDMLSNIKSRLRPRITGSYSDEPDSPHMKVIKL